MKAFPLLVILSSSIVSPSAYAWWMGEGVEVRCQADSAQFPEIGEVYLKGRQLTVQLQGQTHSWSVKTFQLPSHKVWDHSEVQLSVALKAWGSYHDGTLIFKEKAEQSVPLFCYPKK